MITGKEFVSKSVGHLSARLQEDITLFEMILAELNSANNNIKQIVGAYMNSDTVPDVDFKKLMKYSAVGMAEQSQQAPVMNVVRVEQPVTAPVATAAPVVLLKGKTTISPIMAAVVKIVQDAGRPLSIGEVHDKMPQEFKKDQNNTGQILRNGMDSGIFRRSKIKGTNIIKYSLNAVPKATPSEHKKLGVASFIANLINETYLDKRDASREEIDKKVFEKYPDTNSNAISHAIYTYAAEAKRKGKITVERFGTIHNRVYRFTTKEISELPEFIPANKLEALVTKFKPEKEEDISVYRYAQELIEENYIDVQTTREEIFREIKAKFPKVESKIISNAVGKAKKALGLVNGVVDTMGTPGNTFIRLVPETTSAPANV